MMLGDPSVGMMAGAGLISSSIMSYVAGISGADDVLQSSDGSSWNTGTISSFQATDMAWNGSVFCVLKQGSSNVCYTSPDGITWTSRTMASTQEWSGICWNGTIFCAVSKTGNTSTVAATSPDGITWTDRTLPTAHAWRGIAWSGSVFAATAEDSTNAAATSPDGITWTARTMSTTRGSRNRLVHDGTNFFVMEANGAGRGSYSADGITWVEITGLPAVTYHGLAANNGRMVATGTATTTNGALYSTDHGVTWTPVTIPQAKTFREVVWNGTLFVAVGNNSTTNGAMTSTDGTSWTATNIPTSNVWGASASQFLTFGTYGA